LATAAWAEDLKSFDPVAFFTGSTHGRGVLNELLGKEKRTSAQSVGRVDKDGWLILDQTVDVQGDHFVSATGGWKQVAGQVQRHAERSQGTGRGGGGRPVGPHPLQHEKWDQGGADIDCLAGQEGGRQSYDLQEIRMKVATLVERIEKLTCAPW
jgi:hypothetical protein